MSCTPEQIKTNTCTFDINKTLCIKGACDSTSNYNAETANNANTLIWDVVLTATMMIGTVVTIALVVSGVRYIMAGWNMANAADAKKGIKNAIIWLILVVFSYTIVRLIQYIVAWYR